MICYLNDDLNVSYDESGILSNTELRFVNTEKNIDSITISELNQLIENSSYVKEHTISISRKNMPINIVAFMPKKK